MMFLKRYIKYIPVVQLYLSALSCIVPFNFNYSDTIGYSILTSIFYLGFTKDKFILDFVYGLMIMNLVCYFGDYLRYDDFSLIYDFTIFMLCHIRLFKYAR